MITAEHLLELLKGKISKRIPMNRMYVIYLYDDVLCL